jgi:ligand-binding SRPBCC domain-containing protein
MKIHQLQTEIWLPQPRERIFEFFADPGNLERLTPAWLRFRIVTKPREIAEGVLLDYKLRIHGFPIQWQSQITEWHPPHRFVDRQTKGPYRLWLHEHTFHERDGGTAVGDSVQYAVPGGTIVQRLLVAPEVRRIFEYRQKVLRELFKDNKHTADKLC